MDETRQTYHHGDLRKALIDHAMKTIREDGERAFSLRATARAVGVDIAATYRHFTNKAALLDAVVAAAFSELAHDMEKREHQATTSTARFHAIGEAYVDFARTSPLLFRLAFGRAGERGASPNIQGCDSQGRDPHDILQAVLLELEADGLLRVPTPTASIAAWSAIHGLAHLVADGNDLAPLSSTTSAIVGVLLAGMAQEPAEPQEL